MHVPVGISEPSGIVVGVDAVVAGAVEIEEVSRPERVRTMFFRCACFKSLKVSDFIHMWSPAFQFFVRVSEVPEYLKR